MQTITKSKVSNLLLIEYLNKKRYYEEQIKVFENKYKTSFTDFEIKVNEQETESEESWDDYIDWKAHNDFLKDTLMTIENFKYGNFKVI